MWYIRAEQFVVKSKLVYVWWSEHPKHFLPTPALICSFFQCRKSGFSNCFSVLTTLMSRHTLSIHWFSLKIGICLCFKVLQHILKIIHTVEWCLRNILVKFKEWNARILLAVIFLTVEPRQWSGVAWCFFLVKSKLEKCPDMAHMMSVFSPTF